MKVRLAGMLLDDLAPGWEVEQGVPMERRAGLAKVVRRLLAVAASMVEVVGERMRGVGWVQMEEVES